MTCTMFQLEDNNNKYCTDVDDLHRDKDELNNKIKSLQGGTELMITIFH